MVIEAEIKARVRDPQHVRALLAARAAERPSRYRDTYYDLSGQDLARAGRELRLRTEESGGTSRCLLTYKDSAVDERTGSKPETQTEVTDPAAMDAILTALGFAHLVAFEKYCLNYAFTGRGRQMLATLATVPELDGTYLEVETMITDPADLSAALADVRAILADLDIAAEDHTSELYTDAVIRHRSPTG
jgi:adenylate cyclase, class 2